MNLSQYLSEQRGRLLALARAVNAPSSSVSQWASGKRPIPAERCPAIERATNGAVTRRDLRPDDWQRIWPELAARERTRGVEHE